MPKKKYYNNYNYYNNVPYGIYYKGILLNPIYHF
jgi:hypothetical protein